MQNALYTHMDTHTHTHSFTHHRFTQQLKNIHLSTPFNTAVERTQLAREEVVVARSQREESLTRAQTTL
jgi:hypothetical protein